MITVDEEFYEKGCTMEGKENRILLKKDGKTHIEMIFLGDMVEIKGERYCVKKNFDQITLVTVNHNAEPIILTM